MGRRHLIPAALLILGIAGCNRAAPETSLPIVVVDTTEETGVVAMPVADQPATSIRPEEPDTFTPPFPENLDFFSPPANDAPVAGAVPHIAAANSEPLDQPVEFELPDLRVIGFVQVEGEQPKAMLHVDGRLEIVAAGDTVGDLEVLDVSETQVSLQHAGQQLTVGLSDRSAGQNVVAQRQRSEAASRRRGAWSQGSRSVPSDDAGQFPVPVDFAALPAIPTAPSVDVPQIDLPEIPR